MKSGICQQETADSGQIKPVDEIGMSPCPTLITHHTLLRVGSRTKIESLLTPPGSDAASLRRHVESLQLDLEAHMENEKHLQAVNNQLRERLELYMKQNHENVERAEAELNILHEDMEQTLELQRRLAQRSAFLEKEKKSLEQELQMKMQEFEGERSLLSNEIDKMSDNLLVLTNTQTRAEALQAELEATLAAKDTLETNLQNSVGETEALKYEVEKLDSKLYQVLSKENKDQMLERSHNKYLLKRIFHGMWKAVKQQQVQELRKNSASSFAKRSCCRRGLSYLQRGALRAKQLRLGHNRHAHACLEKCFKAWKLYHFASRKYRQAVLRRQKARIHRMLADWYCTVKAGRMSEHEENRLMLVSKRYWSTMLKKRSLKHWMRWIRYSAKPLKGKLNALQRHVETLICGQALASWKCFICKRNTKRSRMLAACLHEKSWRQQLTFNRWQQTVMHKKVKNLLVMRSLNLRSASLNQKVFKAWVLHLRLKQRNHLSRAVTFRHYLRVLQAKVFAWWRAGTKQQQAETRGLHEINHALARTAIILWHDYHVLVLKKKRKEKMASVFKRRRLRKVARNLLLLWWKDIKWNGMNTQFTHVLASRQRHVILSNALHNWMHFTFESLLNANVKFQSDLLDAKAECEAQRNQTAAVDVENLQLIDRLHAMSSDIAHLRIAICEKGKQEEDLRQSLEETAVIQSTMRAELEQQHLHIEELELESTTLEEKLQSQNMKENVGEVQHAFEREGLEKAMKNLQVQIDEKSTQVDSYAKALKDTSERLEGTSDESHEQLSNAFEIAGSLRKILEDRENQFATLEGNCRRRELELSEVQRKLDTSSSAFAETIEARDTRIRELECTLARKQNELQETQQGMRNLQVAVDAKEIVLRKLEYNMKLKSDRDASRTKTFVSSLSSWSSAAGQLDVLAGFQTKASSIQMESMKQLYMQTEAAVQQGMSPDHCVSGYRVSAFKVQTKPSTPEWRPFDSAPTSLPLKKKRQALLASQSFSNSREEEEDNMNKRSFFIKESPVESSRQSGVSKRRTTAAQRDKVGLGLATNSPPDHESHLCGGTVAAECSSRQHATPSICIRRKDDETLVSLPPSYECLEKGDHLCLLASDLLPRRREESSNLKIFLEPVDSLHVEIQQLQARILERMKSSPTCKS